MQQEDIDSLLAHAFEKHYRYLLRVAVRYGPYREAEDIVQSALLRAWRYRGSFRQQANVRTWLYAIVRSEAYCELNLRAERAEEELPEVGKAARRHVTNLDDLLALDRAMRYASERDRRALCRWMDGAPADGESIQHLRTRKDRAIEQIRKQMRKAMKKRPTRA